MKQLADEQSDEMHRVPQLHDLVEVFDRDGQSHKAMIVALAPDPAGMPKITPRFLGSRWPAGFFSHVRFDAAGSPLTWRFAE